MELKEKLLLSPEDFKPYFKDWNIDGIFNPGAIRDKDGKIILFVRVAERFSRKNKYEYPIAIAQEKFDYKIEKVKRSEFLRLDGNIILLKNNTPRLSNISHFRKVILDKTGFFIEKIDQEPFFYPQQEYEVCGVEDPRIVNIGKDYLMTYVSVSIKNGISSSLALSTNLKDWKRFGVIFQHENKDVVLFPGKIKGRYAALHRPVGSFNFTNPSIWISYSKDLNYWGDSEEVISPRKDSFEIERIGAGCPPIKTKKGWLLIYHGVSREKDHSIYSAGACLLDLKDPRKVLARSPAHRPLFKPTNDYEKQGFVNNVIFPTGIILDNDKKSVLIYSGTADKYISVKKVLIKDIIDSLERV